MIELEAIPYKHGDVTLGGLLALPEGPPRAAVVIYPSLINIEDSVRRRARMLAEMGYVTFIADYYGEEADGHEGYMKLANALRADPKYYRARLASALDAVRARPEAASLPSFAIGYCMGGGAAIEMARDGQDILAVVSFHGVLATALPAQPGAVSARILVLHGDADPFIPRDQVIAFWEEMDRAGASWHFHSYSGVKHSFTDPEIGRTGLESVAYDASADRQSWAAMSSLFDELLD